jgi:phage baseplate assembly protein W
VPDDFIGRGWAFPLRVDDTGRIALVGGHRELEESIRLILGTAFRERPMRPEFGCGIHDFVFAPINATAMGQIEFEVRASLTRWEPRIDLVEVAVHPDLGRDGTLFIDVHYVEKGTNDVRNLVFPFYVINSEDDGLTTANAGELERNAI